MNCGNRRDRLDDFHQGMDSLSFEIDDLGEVKSVSPIKKKSVKALFGVIKTDLKLDLEQARNEYQREAAEKIMSELKDESQ
jgi:hypothetical protein